MRNEQVTEIGPLFARKEGHQGFFNGDRVGFAREAQSATEALHVRVDDNAFVDVEGVTQHNVRGFATNAAQRDEFFERCRNFPVEFVHQGRRHGEQTLCFGAKESRGFDEFFDIGCLRIRQCFCVWIAFEQRWRYEIDANIGALRAEYGGRQ